MQTLDRRTHTRVSFKGTSHPRCVPDALYDQEKVKYVKYYRFRKPSDMNSHVADQKYAVKCGFAANMLVNFAIFTQSELTGSKTDDAGIFKLKS